MRIPGRDGPELHAALRAQQPDLPVVFVSGFLEDPRLVAAIGDVAHQRVVPKPFRRAQLLEAIESVLEASRVTTES